MTRHALLLASAIALLGSCTREAPPPPAPASAPAATPAGPSAAEALARMA